MEQPRMEALPRSLLMLTALLLSFLSSAVGVDTMSMSISPSSSMDYVDINMTSTTDSVPTVTPSSTPSWVEEHLSLIIGVPTGIGLCLLMLLACLIYCGISALYHSIRERRAAQGDSTYQGSGAGTRMTGMGGTMPNNSSAYNSSGYHASYFEPSDDTLPRKPKQHDDTREDSSAF